MAESEMQKIAEEGVTQIVCAMEQMNWLRGTLNVLRDRLRQDQSLEHYATLAGLAIYNLDDWHNFLDCQREDLIGRIDKAKE